MADDRELEGRVAVITGGAGGMGRAFGDVLAADGAIVVVADLEQPMADEAASRLPGAWGTVVDVTDRASCRALVDAVVAREGRLDILVNNAGLQFMAPIHEYPEDRWDYLIAAMLTGPFLLTRYVLPGMYERGWGRIVNMGSIHSLVASPNKGAYTAAKHGLYGLTKATALEAGAFGVTANLLCPTYTRTAIVERQVADQARLAGIPESEVLDKVMLASSAVKRLLEPREIAAYLRFLCSEAAGGITGTAQVIDGGWTAR